MISVQNNLNISVYVAVSSSIPGSGQTSQFPIPPKGWEGWSRQGPEIVHVSMAGTLGPFRTYTGRLGETVNIDNRILDSEWNGNNSFQLSGDKV
jgi:hypothetical protein